MKHGRLDCHGRGGVAIAAICILVAAAPAVVRAQLHSGGQRQNYSAVGTGSGTGSSGLPTAGTGGYNNPNRSAMIRRGELQKAAIVDTGYIDGTSLVSTDMRDADLWARAIIHSDGSYTETKKDEDSHQMTQVTTSASGVRLQERIIMADGQGFPSEVLIKDARGNFKYRGILLYDRYGRFTEERLFNMDNQLLRRRIQEYAPTGEPKLRVVDYVKNLPADIQLVITEETVAGNNTERARRNYDRFVRDAREVQVNSASQPAKKKGLLGRIFGRKKKN